MQLEMNSMDAGYLYEDFKENLFAFSTTLVL